MNCLNCQKETTNPKFCSRSCSAIVTNKTNPKRKTKRKCIICGIKVSSYLHSRCKKHRNQYERELLNNKTLQEFIDRPSITNKHPAWYSVYIRNMCRYEYRHLKKLPCHNCGYNKHVELAHIKPVSKFPKTALIKEINAKENIIQLCRNCHWEFDNGLIQL